MNCVQNSISTSHVSNSAAYPAHNATDRRETKLNALSKVWGQANGNASILDPLKLEIYVRLPVVLYGCETWSLTLREEHRFRGV
jgi:hypothetical protein